MNDCLFCKIVAKEIPADIVRETEHTLSFLDIRPLNLGHTLVIPKQHFKDLLETPEEVIFELTKEFKALSVAIKEAMNADGINLGQNNGTAAGQVIFHTHFHVIPRYLNDGYVSWKKHGDDPTKREMAETLEKIKKSLGE